MPLTEGEYVGPYQIIEKLGQGGMATVYKAYHAGLDRYVALKVLHPNLTEDSSFTARFQREARLVAKLDHPNIVLVHDFAEHNGYPYLVMKFIEGETLKARLGRAPLESEEIKNIVDSVGAALAYAHKQGILHRDIKPSNVLMARDGQIYLADFGLARIAQSGASTLSSDAILGTPQYISPEQAIGKSDLDEGTDIYSLGVMLYEMVVGQVPFSADTPFSIIYDHISSPLPLPRSVNPAVPESVERVLLKALAKERGNRYNTVDELVAAFKSAWEEAGIPMQGTVVKLTKGTEPVPKEAHRPAKMEAAKRKQEAPAKKKPKGKLPTWIFLAGGAVLIICCLIAGAVMLPGVLNWLNPTVTEEIPPETESAQFDFCTGEQTWLTRDYFPDEEIQYCWDQEHYLTDLTYSNGEWTVVMTKTVSYTDQAYLIDPEFPETSVREYWDQDFDITSISFINGEWVVVMSAGTGFSNQTYFSGVDFPDAQVKDYWNEGYAITALDYDTDFWVIVMSEGTAFKDQEYFVEAAFPENQIQTYWDSDYYVTNISYGSAAWAVVMSTGEMYSNQYYYKKDVFPESSIREDWDNDFFITDMVFGDPLWIVIMSKP